MPKKYSRKARTLGLTGEERNDRDQRAMASLKWREGYLRCLRDVKLVAERLERRDEVAGREYGDRVGMSVGMLEMEMDYLKELPTDGDTDEGHRCQAIELLHMAIPRMDPRQYARNRKILMAIPYPGYRKSALMSFRKWTVKRFVREARRVLRMMSGKKIKRVG